MRRGRVPALLLALLAGTVLLAPGSADLQIPRSPDRWVTDTAGFLTPGTAQELDRQLESFESETGHQILVYIGKTTDSYPIEDFATRTFQAWRVGRKGLDDGLVLFIMAEDKKIRIEVGYGLEPVVPDIVAGRVINDVMVPKIRAGDRDGAVRDAVAALLQTISGRPPAAASGEEETTQAGRPAAGMERFHTLKTIGIIIVAIFFLILFITNPSLALWLLFSIMSGGRGGGFGGGRGGGGFSGGGGRSGGGGASGGW